MRLPVLRESSVLAVELLLALAWDDISDQESSDMLWDSEVGKTNAPNPKAEAAPMIQSLKSRPNLELSSAALGAGNSS